jgi:serine/threonine protein kinase
MTPEELVATWLRHLAARKLAPGEKRELLQAMEADPALKDRILGDAEIDGLLRTMGAGEQDAEAFVKAISDFLSAEGDASGFVGRVESRMAREGIFPPAETADSDASHNKFRSDFGNAGSMQYNSDRTPMASIVTLEGSEEDFARLLVYHRIINKDQLQRAMEERQSQAAKGGELEPLRDTLLRTKTVASPLIFEVLRTASKVVEMCTKCNATHQIYFYHPGSRYFCTFCKGPLRVTDPGQSLKWQPGQLVESVRELSAPMSETPTEVRSRIEKPFAPAPASNPLDDPSFNSPFSQVDPTVKMASGPESPDKSVTIMPGGDETMLDMGVTPRTSSKPNAPAASSTPPAPPPPPATTDGLPSWMSEDESMLDLGAVQPPPKTGTRPKPAPLPKLAKEGEPERKPNAPPDKSVTMAPGGGTTMLGLGDAARTPFDPSQSVIPGAGAGETMLDMGVTPPPKKSPADMSTSLFGSKRALPVGVPKAPPEIPKLPTETNSYDVTRIGTKTDPTLIVSPTSGVTPRTSSPSSSSSSVDKTQIQHTTPKTGMGPGAALANAKALPPEVAQAAKDPNRVFGKYVLMSELGRGGAGVVYKAWDTLILQYVALKFIKNQDDTEGDTESGSSQIEEFQREARMSVRLRHPNIVRIYELGCMSNRYYLSMEYIEGGNLLQMIHGGKDRNIKTRYNSDPIKFLKIMQNIALAVDYAHNTKPPIIHRDLKPHNVLVDTRGNPYVVDFGLAKEVEQGDGATLTGVVKGTPTYMAPEQAEGRNRDVDARTDVYALGAILYEVLTGRPPFLGESVPEILRKIATELPERPNDVITKTAISEAASSTANSKTKTKPLLIPKPLETICLKSIEKGKGDRYQTAKELAEDIERYLKDEDILAQEPNLYRRIKRKIRQHPILTAAAAALVLASFTGGIVARVTSKGPDTSKQDSIARAVARGEAGMKRLVNGRHDPDWAAVKAAIDDLMGEDKNHPKIAVFENAMKDYEKLKDRTRREWSLDLDRIRREQLSSVLGKLRAHYKKCPELQPELWQSLNTELTALKGRVLDEARRLVGSGARPAWVEEIIKKNAREAREQAESLIGLAKDPDFKYEVEKLVEEARDGLSQVIAYQGTWALQVNVVPFAEVTVSRADKEVTNDFTPLGLQELEVVGSSYIVELFWPSKENPKVRMKEEVKDLHHGQVVVIRGDLAKESLKQERK